MNTKVQKIFNTLQKYKCGFSSVRTIAGSPVYQKNTKEVQLRGQYLQGNYNDLPNLIFFPEACDTTQNWVDFFKSKDNKFLDYRNVYILNPRNFGNSDRNPSYDLEDQANDVVRFMYENKISTATLGGHGFGAKVALAVGCYHVDRVTGVFQIDSAPIDHRAFEPYQEFKQYISTLRNNFDLKRTPKAKVEQQLNDQIECPKWRKIFKQNLVTDAKSGALSWNFELEYLYQNTQFNKADAIGNWAQKHGLYTGRFMSIFAEYSRWVHLNNNTLRYFQTCTRTKGFGNDLFYITGDENPLNHWVYDFEHSEFVASRKILKFLTMWDGVHVLLKDRSEIGKFFIPDMKNSRKNDSDHVYSDYTPAHYHHNWRYSNIYEESEKYAKNPNYTPK